MKVTGWNKDEFLNFSEYIFGISDTKNRTKHQLIALYRYWLRTGIDQKSLALLFGNETKQQQISLYLDEARVAINKYFVPRYLGAKNDRSFYLQFNTKMSHSILNLATDNLVVIMDGTYNQIEKSANNDFQYKTYSGQQCQNLLKPFLVCCADGYIIDCYGPFPGNTNDATILKYILEKDKDLENILEPFKTTIILDRGNNLLPDFPESEYFSSISSIYFISFKGFRDNIAYLTERNLNPKIPTCAQLETVIENS